MNKQLLLVWCLALSISSISVHAAPAAPAAPAAAKGMAWSGSFTGGYFQSFTSGTSAPRANGFLVDRMKMRLDGTLSDKTTVVFQKAFFVLPQGQNNATVNTFNSLNFTSPAAYRLSTGNLALALEAAYIDHKCGEGMHTWLGFFGTPFGMESMVDRGDMANYYYSSFYRNNFVGLGVNYDLGIKMAFTNLLPGTLEVAVMDGRGQTTGPSHYSPALALRYSMESKSGDFSLTPVASVFLSHWAGFAKTMMFSAGVMAKMGAMWGNLEFLYGSDQTNPAGVAGSNGTNNRWSLYAEPGFDFGMVNLSVKAEMTNFANNGGGTAGAIAAQSDYNIGVAVGHTYEGDLSVKLAYAITNLNGTDGLQNVNDLRLLLSTKW